MTSINSSEKSIKAKNDSGRKLRTERGSQLQGQFIDSDDRNCHGAERERQRERGENDGSGLTNNRRRAMMGRGSNTTRKKTNKSPIQSNSWKSSIILMTTRTAGRKRFIHDQTMAHNSGTEKQIPINTN